jgi:hypothetical protein
VPDGEGQLAQFRRAVPILHFEFEVVRPQLLAPGDDSAIRSRSALTLAPCRSRAHGAIEGSINF